MTALRLTLILFLLLSVPLAFAAPPPTPQQFVIGFPLQTEGDAAFYQLELPLEVYKVVTRSDIADLRVFNSSGAVVPHQLQPLPSFALNHQTQNHSLAFFPLRSRDEYLPDNLSLRIQRNRDGTLVELQTTDPQNDNPPHIVGWLVDLGSAKTAGGTLLLNWNPVEDDVLGEIQIDSSQDLAHWEPLAGAAVADLSHHQQHLLQNQVVLPQQAHRYLRISWPSQLDELSLTGIELLQQTRQARKHPLHKLAIQSAFANQPSTFDLVLPGPISVEEVTILLPEPNQLAECRLMSTADQKGDWKTHWRGLTYRIDPGRHQLSTPTISIDNSRNRYWRLRCLPSEAGLSTPPTFEIGWRPDRLLFLAHGTAPFMLAAGSRIAGPTHFPVDRIDIKNIVPGQASVGEAITLGSASVLLAPREPVPWKKIFLWLLLGGGVLLIGGLAYSLYRQFDRDKQAPPGHGD